MPPRVARWHVRRPWAQASTRELRQSVRPAPRRRRGQFRRGAPRSVVESPRTTLRLCAWVRPRSSRRARAELAAPGQCARLEVLKPEAPEPDGDCQRAPRERAVERPPRVQARGLAPRPPLPRQWARGPGHARPAPEAHQQRAAPTARPVELPPAVARRAPAVPLCGRVVMGPARRPVAEQGSAAVAARGLREAATM